MALITDPQAARRLARAIVSDIELYNAEKIKNGIEKDTLFDSIKDELDEGRALFKDRVAPGVAEQGNFFDLAVVDVLLKHSAKYNSKIW